MLYQKQHLLKMLVHMPTVRAFVCDTIEEMFGEKKLMRKAKAIVSIFCLYIFCG